MPFSKKKLFLRFVVAILLLVLGIGGLLYARLSDQETVKGMVIAELEKHLKRKITIDSIEVLFDEGLTLGLRKFALYSASGSRPDFDAARVLVGFHVVPFLSGQVSIRSITVEGVALEVARQEDGVILVNGSDPTAGVKTDEGLQSLVFAGLIRTITFKNGTLRFIDKHVIPGSKVMTFIEDIDATVSRSLLASSLMTQISGNVKVNADSYSYFQTQVMIDFPEGFAKLEKVLFDGKLEMDDFTLSPFLAYFPESASGLLKATRMDAKLAYHWAPQKPLQVSGSLTHYPENDDSPALTAAGGSYQGVLQMDLIWDGETFTGNKLDYRSGSFHILASGTWQGRGSAPPHVEFEMKSIPWTVESIHSGYPFKLLPATLRDSIRDWIQRGELEITSLSFKGSPLDWTEWGEGKGTDALSMDLKLRNVDLGPALSDLKNITGSLSYQKNTVRMEWNEARYRSFQLNNVKGTLSQVFVSPHADLEFQLIGRVQDHYRQLPKTGRGLSQKTVNQWVQQLEGYSKGVLHVTGPLEQPELLKIQADLTITKGQVQMVGLGSPIKQIQGDLHFENFPSIKNSEADFEVRFTNLSAQCRNHLFKGFAGQARVRKGKLTHHIKGRVQFGAFQGEDVAALQTDNRLKEFLRELEFSSGNAQIDYKEERKLGVTTPLMQKGSIRLQKVSVRHQGKFRPLNNVSGQFEFHGKKITFESKEAFYGNTPVAVQAGVFGLGSSKPELILKVNGKSFHSEDFSGLPFLGKLKAEGPVAVQATLHATESTLSLKNKVDLTRAAYRYQDWFVKPAKTPNQLEMMAVFSEQHPVEFKSLAFDLNGNRMMGKGWLGPGDQPEFTLSVAGKNIETKSVAPFIKTLSEAQGGAFDFDVSVKGLVDKPGQADYKGFVKVRQINFTSADLMVPVQVTADTWFVNRVVKIKNGLLDFKRSALAFEGKYIFGSEPELELMVAGDRLNLNEVLAPGEKSDKAGLPDLSHSQLLMKGKGTVQVNIDEVVYGYWNLHRVAGAFQFQKGRVDTRDLLLGRSGKELLGVRARMAVGDPEGPKIDAILTTRNTQAQEFFNRFGDTFESCLEGRVVLLQARLRTKGRTLKAITKNLNGDLVLEVQGGRIHTGNMLNGSAKMFGYKLDPKKAQQRRQKKKEPYKLIQGGFKIRNGVAATDNFVFEDNDALMSLVGTFDLNRHDMNIVVGVAPLRSVDKFIKKIPLIGKIITAGDEESIFKNYYEITGPFSGPETKAVPFTSLGKKVVGMVQGIFQAPSDILFGTEDDSRKN